MVLRIVEEIRNSLDNNLYLSALITALTLPDICGKAEYPKFERRTKQRYIKWYDEYIGKYEQDDLSKENDIPYESGQIIYSLRNSLVHSGNPDIDEEECDIQEFDLLLEDKNQFNIYVGSSGVRTDYVNEEVVKVIKSLCINVRQLCLNLCSAAEFYYNNNREKFDFFNSKLTYWNPQARKVFR